MKKLIIILFAIAVSACGGNKKDNSADSKQKQNTDVANNEIKTNTENEIVPQEGFTMTESGLQYKILRDAQGPKPGPTSIVKVHYEGKLTNGHIFDSSYERKEPTSFGLNEVIKGWTEGVQLMSVGSMCEFIIPPKLGYGNRELPEIPANSTLIFKIELLEILK